ncbi:MAG TPA: DUF4139 domain-containing protein [Stellaceae bacterium]|nr:DUF4139 domain-containing protein [Stellaceae bacterium]
MKRCAVPTFVLVLLCVVGAPAWAGDLTLKRVMLSTGGVAYLEYEAAVDGDATLTLNVPLDQVDDVLKSIVVYDSKGGVGAASLPGRQPLAQLFNDLPFGPEALASPAALLNALQGAEIRVGASHPITGKLLRVVAETTRATDGTTTSRNRVSVLTSEGLQQFILEDADSVRFVDAELQVKVDQALSEIASHRAKDRRAITLTTRGTGTRTLRVGYVVAAPLWKASFRLSLPAEANTAHLQGWAVLENMSGEDWAGVELTLLSGNPVSFRQAIYQAYYVNRPEVPVEVAGRILPRQDMGTVDQIRTARAAYDKAMQFAPASVAAGAAQAQNSGGALAQMKALSGNLEVERTPEEAATVDTAEAQESMTQVSFRIPVPVTIESGHSALVPLVDRDVPAERLDLLQPATSALHPLAAVKLTNDTASGLPPGVVTLYEQTPQGAAYLGDARLAGLPAGESRLLSYALDAKTKVLRDDDRTSVLTKGTIAEGVLHLIRTDRQTLRYTIAAPKTEARRIIVEQPMSMGWTLVEPAGKTVEETATAYRVAIDLKPGETQSLRFTLEHPREETLRVLDIDDAQLGVFVKDTALAPPVRTALGELARLRRVVADKKAAAERINGAIAGIADDQSRIRANLERVDKESALHKRYIEKLADEETRIEGLQAERARAADETRAAQAAVEAYIAKLSI